DEIKGVINQARGLLIGQGRLQRRKVGGAIVSESGNFAVHYHGITLEITERFCYLGKATRPVLAVAAQQGDLAIVEDGQDAVAVELDFMQPLSAGGSLAGGGGEKG